MFVLSKLKASHKADKSKEMVVKPGEPEKNCIISYSHHSPEWEGPSEMIESRCCHRAVEAGDMDEMSWPEVATGDRVVGSRFADMVDVCQGCVRMCD